MISRGVQVVEDSDIFVRLFSGGAARSVSLIAVMNDLIGSRG
jgi:hypothetical protein